MLTFCAFVRVRLAALFHVVIMAAGIDQQQQQVMSMLGGLLFKQLVSCIFGHVLAILKNKGELIRASVPAGRKYE